MCNEKKNAFIVIDGIDGSGKETQSVILKDWLEQKGKTVRKISFPDYNNPSSALVKMYLHGEIAPAEEINTYAASSFYAADRYISYKTDWEKDCLEKDFIVADRYTTSNIIHQMARLPENEREEYMKWLYDFEYGKMKLPAPDLVIYLDMPPEITKKLIEKRYGGDESKKDILEKDFDYMEKCRSCALFAADKLGFKVVNCFEGDEPLTIEEISCKIQIEVTKFFNL